jgi:amidohydrolase
MSAGDRITASAEALAGQLTEWRRHLHEHPELSFQEYETTDFLERTLRGFGVDPVRKTETGLWFDIEGARSGRTVLVRADIDALPIEEEADVPYRSGRPGVMHACGHDGHTAIALGVTKLLLERRAAIAGRVRVLFQPAEEKLPGGAPMMIRAGVLEGVDEAVGLHLMPMRLWAPGGVFPVGRAALIDGPAMAAAEEFRIRIRGVGGHGAAPHTAVDAIACATQVVNALQHIVSRQVDPLQPAVVTVGTFHAGYNFNVIAPQAELTGTVRAFDESVRDRMEESLRRIVRQTADAFGATADVEYTRGYPPLVNTPEQAEVVRGVVRELYGQDALEPAVPMMGAEDFAYILQERPGAFLWLGCGSEELEATYANHHPKFAIDERALPIGAAVLATAALRLLER